MGRRPIIIPRHQSSSSSLSFSSQQQQQQPPKQPCFSTTGANGFAIATVLAHPLALMNISGIDINSDINSDISNDIDIDNIEIDINIHIDDEENGSGRSNSSIGIRRHGPPQQSLLSSSSSSNQQQFSTPEKNKKKNNKHKRSRMVRNKQRSPTSIILPLDFIEEEVELEEVFTVEEEERFRQTTTTTTSTNMGNTGKAGGIPHKNSSAVAAATVVRDGKYCFTSAIAAAASQLFHTKFQDNEPEPESVMSGGSVVLNSDASYDVDDDECNAFFSNYNRPTVDDDNHDDDGGNCEFEARLSEFFDTSDFGSVIEHVNESDDYGHHHLVVLPNKNENDNNEDEFDDDRSNGTFSEMMLHQQEEQLFALQQQQQQEEEEEQQQHLFAPSMLLTTSTRNSSILTTSTLEPSLEQQEQQQKRKQFQFQQKHPPTIFGEALFPMQRILQAATHNISQKNNEHERGKSNTNTNTNTTINNNNNTNTTHEDLVMPTLSHPPLMLPEEQRRAALARYRYNQIIHTKTKSHPKRNDEQTTPAASTRKEQQQSFAEDRETNCSQEDIISPEESFASTIDDELRSLKNSALVSNESFRKVETRLSRDLHESDAKVTMLEADLVAAKKQRELCRERYGFVKAKREKEKELEIHGNGGTNDRARRMLLEHRKQEIIAANTTLHRQHHQQKQQQHDANKENLEDDTSFSSTSPGLIFAGSRREKNFRESHLPQK